jgi:ATP-dependent DNA ligase
VTDQTIDPAATMPGHRGAMAAMAELRPQPFGKGSLAKMSDPLIEPLWPGVRALAAIEAGAAALADAAGHPIDDQPAVVEALAEAARAEGLVLDGFLSKQGAPEGSRPYVGLDSLPAASQMISRPLLGATPALAVERTRAREAAREARTFGPEDTVRFVATDLLWLDEESLLDVPLLERRRLLDSVLIESELVRRGVFVRPPVETWIGSWRSLGFTELVYRSANSRYRPGQASPDWIVLPMPRR